MGEKTSSERINEILERRLHPCSLYPHDSITPMEVEDGLNITVEKSLQNRKYHMIINTILAARHNGGSGIKYRIKGTLKAENLSLPLEYDIKAGNDEHAREMLESECAFFEQIGYLASLEIYTPKQRRITSAGY